MTAPPRILRARGRVLELGGEPLLMGIVNATPDSFSDAGELPDLEARVARARSLAAAGAAIIDVGGETAAGGLPTVDAEEEIARVVPVVARIAGELDVLVSVDTHKPAVAAAAVAAGAAIVNDVSGLRDRRLADVCAGTGAALVVMHTRAAPKATLLDPDAYADPAGDVRELLADRMAAAIAAGVGEEQILLDPGPDFAKTPAQTVAVLRRLDDLHALGRPLLLPISRKDFLGAITGRGPRERAAATLAAVGWAADAGVHVLRVHDVAAAADFLAVRAVLRGERELAPTAGLTPERYPGGMPDAVRRRLRDAAAEPDPQPARALTGGPARARYASSRTGCRSLRTTRPGADHPSPRSTSMSVVLDRESLAESPLADLHFLANELGVDGFRRLRKPDLIEAIIARQSADTGDAAAPDTEEAAPEAEEAAPSEEEAAPAPRRRRRRAATEPAAPADAEPVVASEPEPEPPAEEEEEEGTTDEDAAAAPRRGRRGGRGRGRTRNGDEAPTAAEEPAAEQGGDRIVEGVIELLGNGSAFVRLTQPEATDDDVYVSAAQVKRCELVSGDRVGGPVRAPRRSERHPSLVRVDTINGRPADEVAEGTRFEDMPVAWPAERIALEATDPTLKAVEWLTPFGKGSRVLVTGAPRAGKSELVRRLAGALAGREGLELFVVLAGVRPEEIADWPEATAALTFAASPDAQAQAVEQAVEQGRRVAARGGDAVVVIDTLELLPAQAARRALAAARNLAEGGSLTIVATAPAPLGGETTVVALDAQLTALRRFPALDLAAGGTLRPELLVGDAGAEAIATARADALAT